MFVATSLLPGGTERIISLMTDYWLKKDWDLTIVTSFESPEGPFFPLQPGIKLTCMHESSHPYSGPVFALSRHLREIWKLRRAVIQSAPHCILAFGYIHAVRSILATAGLGIPVVVSEQDDPSRLGHVKNGKIWGVLRSLCYGISDAVVVLTQAGKDFLGPRIGSKVRVIPNPVSPDPDTPARSDTPRMDLPEKTIASMGRFTKEKRFDLLLRAFAEVVKHRDCRLVLVGDGPLRTELTRLKDELGLTHRVDLPGFVKNPWQFLKNAYAFVLSSEIEAFGLVIVESMAHGVPVISFDCPNGPREIIREGIDGILVPPLDVEALAQAMEALLNDESKRNVFSTRCIEVRERFRLETIMEAWTEILEAVCERYKRD